MGTTDNICGRCACYQRRPFHEDECSYLNKVVPFLAVRECFTTDPERNIGLKRNVDTSKHHLPGEAKEKQPRQVTHDRIKDNPDWENIIRKAHKSKESLTHLAQRMNWSRPALYDRFEELGLSTRTRKRGRRPR